MRTLYPRGPYVPSHFFFSTGASVRVCYVYVGHVQQLANKAVRCGEFRQAAVVVRAGIKVCQRGFLPTYLHGYTCMSS